LTRNLTDLTRGTVEPVVLALLAERAMYGYEIVKLVHARTEGVLAYKEGSLYPALHRLEGEKLITAQWREAESGKRRKYYALTAAGEQALRQQREQWASFSGAVNTLLFGTSAGA
jgi:transcriptional regulator